MEKDFLIRKINVKETATFKNEENLRDLNKEAKIVEKTRTKLKVSKPKWKRSWYVP